MTTLSEEAPPQSGAAQSPAEPLVRSARIRRIECDSAPPAGRGRGNAGRCRGGGDPRYAGPANGLARA
jgi:hypothetical protein